MRVGGVVLCGGRSSRMGTPKAWLPVGGEPMLLRVVGAVGGAASPVVVVAAAGQDVPSLPPGVRLVRDEVEGRGPLAGLVAGLAALDGEADAAFVAGCDLPFLTAAFVRRVTERLDAGGEAVCRPNGAVDNGPGRKPWEPRHAPDTSPPAWGAQGLRPGLFPDAPLGLQAGFDAAVPFVAGRPHPLAAAYRMAVLPVARGHLLAGQLRMTELLAAVPTRFVGEAELGDDAAAVRNVNTPDEFAAIGRTMPP